MSWRNWHTFKEGQARFAGSIRGWDELGHDTFAIQLDGREYFGEIKDAWLPNQCDFNVEVLSFGYGMQLCVGIPLTTPSVRAFSPRELQRIMSLVVQLVRATDQSDDKPFVMSSDSESRFMGQVIFREGWALALNVGSTVPETFRMASCRWISPT
jgi:hypothetical protein